MKTTQLPLTRRTVLVGGLGASLATALSVSPASAATTYRRGSRGSGVRRLQRDLSARGYWCGRADGVFGHLTQQAVWALQKRHGLVRDAIVGPNTRSALARDTRLRPVGGSGSRFEVHLSRQLLLEVRSGRTHRVFNTSTGNGEPYDWYGRTYRANTYKGSFAVHATHSSGWQTGQLGKMYRPSYFDRGRAIHGSLFIPPYPDSHGCCRVSTAAADLLWATGSMSRGNRVLVVA
ncbi:MAG: L,D-transpeptidase family protein [Ornithinimicrobium sp.]